MQRFLSRGMYVLQNHPPCSYHGVTRIVAMYSIVGVVVTLVSDVDQWDFLYTAKFSITVAGIELSNTPRLEAL